MGFMEMREKANLRQTEVARVLGVSQGAVANWEAGLNNPTADKLIKMATLYRCTVDELLKGSK